MHSKVVAQWSPSVSTDVDFVEVVWSLDGVDSPAVNVANGTNEADSPFADVDGHNVGVKATVVNTSGIRSSTVTANVDVPVLPPSSPEPVTNLVLNVVPVV